MLKKIAILILFVLAELSCLAQTDPSLDAYLTGHRYTVRINPDSTVSFEGTGIPELLATSMQGKKLFIYGQGYSHMLRLNNSIHLALLTYFAGHGLKYVFDESPRSWIVDQNLFNRNSAIAASTFYNDRPAFYQRSFERSRSLFQHSSYQYRALDFERPHSFYHTFNRLAENLDAQHQASFLQLVSYLRDTTYLTLSADKFVSFYKQQQKIFYKDSAQLHEALGDNYADFKYLITDPEPSTYTDNRNAMMAAHLLQQIHPIAAGDIYFASCGMAHSRPGKKDGTNKSMAHLLEVSEELRDKVVVMNLYCEDCHAEGGGDNWALGFMKGSVLESFQKAAQSEIVLFDLSGLDGKYEYIRQDYGDMLVFARNQQ